MKIRKMRITDYNDVYSLWHKTPEMGLNDIDDSQDGIAKYLKRNPRTCFVVPKKLRKMLGDVNSPSAVALRELIDTQSKDTIRKWCLEYAEAKLLPIFESHCLGDDRPRNAVNAAHDYLNGKVKFPVSQRYNPQSMPPRRP